MDDSISLRRLGLAYKPSDYGLLLGYPPGVDNCGGRYPIWRKGNKRHFVFPLPYGDADDVYYTVYIPSFYQM